MAALILLGRVLFLCRAGFDFTDEGFYLHWISSPHDFAGSVTQFGFVYHPLYVLLSGDLVWLRRANVLIVYGTAFALCLALLYTVLPSRNGQRIDVRAAALAFVLASGSLVLFHMWLPTPGYNSLTFLSVMMAAIGTLLTGQRNSSDRIWWALIGVAGTLTFLAKPTSAALLALAVAIYLPLAGKLEVRGVLICTFAAASTLVLSAILIDGTPVHFVERLKDGLQLAQIHVPDGRIWNLFRLDDFSLSDALKIHFGQMLAFALLMVLLMVFESSLALLLVSLSAMGLAGMSIALTAGWLGPPMAYHPFQPMLFLAVPIAILPFTLIALPSRGKFATALFLLVLPFVYAFGTSNNYLEQGGRVGLFILLGSLVIGVDLAARKVLFLTVVAAIALLVPTIALQSAMQEPYRQIGALPRQTTKVLVGPRKFSIQLDEGTKNYVLDLQRLASKGGFRTGDLMIDLSGVSPGAVFLLGGRPPGLPWVGAGYPGSNNYLHAALDRAGCGAVAVSWILTEPGSRFSFSFNLLRRYGIDVARDYQEVGVVHARRSYAPRDFEELLLKPMRDPSVAIDACQKSRQDMFRVGQDKAVPRAD